MDELTRLLAELEPVPDAVWMRVMANALDPTAIHEDLANLVPASEADADLPGDASDLLDDDPGPEDREVESLVWTEDLDVRVQELDARSVDPEPDHLGEDGGGDPV